MAITNLNRLEVCGREYNLMIFGKKLKANAQRLKNAFEFDVCKPCWSSGCKLFCNYNDIE